ncbi:MAG: penicillin-binding protein 2 [Pyrinomonadaceae bacterium]|nr:penicillin-binding protein 2 [Pyrinomonadaceae bacterium]
MPASIRKKDFRQETFVRFLLIVALFTIWLGIIGIRLVYLQISQHEFFKERAISQRRDKVRKRMMRGTIYDRSGRALAMSVKARSLFLNPQEIENPFIAAEILASVFKFKKEEILKELLKAKQEGKRFFWVGRKIEEEQAKRISETLQREAQAKGLSVIKEQITGFYWQEDQKRVYPLGSLAANVIGFSNIDDVGQAGIELSQESNLRGAVVRKWQERDRLGRVFDSEMEEKEPPKDVYLTISASIQHRVEEALKEGVEKAKAKSGIAIVIEPKTGEILAMANYPSFDPNFYSRFSSELFSNRAIQNVFAPGSTFKVVSYGAALDRGLIAPDEVVDCGNGVIQIADRKFKDTHCRKSFQDSIVVSSNIAAIRAAQRLGEDGFYSYLRAFGFGEQTGIELPAESTGILSQKERWSSASLASIAIGYEIGVTALQMALVFATVANDGVMMKPRIVKEIRYSEGTYRKMEPEARKVLEEQTASVLRKMLYQVVLRGTGRLADPDGYTAAGKTGTAWKYDEKLKKYNSEKYVSSFIGFAPVQKPAAVVAVVLDEPRTERRNGGDVAAPIFRRIMEQILPELQIPPDEALVAEEKIETSNTDFSEVPRVTVQDSDRKTDEKRRRKRED